MKNLFTTLLFVLIISIANGQSFEMSRNYVSAGYGFGNFIQLVFKSYQSYDDYSFKYTGPAFAKFEHALNDNMGIGIAVSYVNASVSYIDKSYLVDTVKNIYYKQTIKWASYSILARLNFHFANSERFDPYWGFGVGYRGASWKYEDNDPNYDNQVSASNLFPFGLEATLGARYYFTPSIAAYTEVGFAKAIVQFGLTAGF